MPRSVIATTIPLSRDIADTLPLCTTFLITAVSAYRRQTPPRMRRVAIRAPCCHYAANAMIAPSATATPPRRHASASSQLTATPRCRWPCQPHLSCQRYIRCHDERWLIRRQPPPPLFSIYAAAGRAARHCLRRQADIDAVAAIAAPAILPPLSAASMMPLRYALYAAITR